MGLFDRMKRGKKGVDERSETLVVKAPASGNVVRMEDLPDPVFAGGMMGRAVGIRPECGEVFLPVDGTILAAMPHAFGLACEDGVEVIVHVGVDTVEMKGDGFDVKVKKGQAVKAGSALVAFDRDKVAKAGYDDTVIMAVSNSGDLEEQGRRVKVAEAENVEVGDTLITVAR